MNLSLFFKYFQKAKTKTSWNFKIFSYLTKYIRPNSNVTSVVCDTGDAVEELLQIANKALRSKRLFFQPSNTSSILETAKFQFNDCVTLAIDSEDPYLDFRRSMEEMVEAYGLKKCEHLEELLALYLNVNKKKNHGLIVAAFIVVFGAGISSCAAASSSSSSKSKSCGRLRSRVKAFLQAQRSGNIQNIALN